VADGRLEAWPDAGAAINDAYNRVWSEDAMERIGVAMQAFRGPGRINGLDPGRLWKHKAAKLTGEKPPGGRRDGPPRWRTPQVLFGVARLVSGKSGIALRKLLKLGLLSSEKRGKEVFYGTSPAGAALCDAYRDVRERCFLDGLSRLDMTGEEMRDIAASLRSLSGQYDQASRAAASL
jgi:hypothetical protein